MERKRGIPLVALIIFIALLVAVILTCVIIFSTHKNNGQSTPVDVAQTEEPTVTEEPEEEDKLIASYEDEKDLNNDVDVQNAYKTVGNNKTFAKYEMYQTGGFDTEKDQLSNDFKLILAFSQITNEDMNKDSGTKSISVDTIEKYAQKIFEESDDINYTDVNLYHGDPNYTEQYKISGYVYDEEANLYKVKEEDVTEEKPSLITEVMTRADVYTNKVEIYVRPIYINSFYYDSDEDNIHDYISSIYYTYNYQTQEYGKHAFMSLYSDFEQQTMSSMVKDLDGYSYNSISNVDVLDFNQLEEYKYTLVKKDGDYKIKSFERLTEDPEPVEITSLDADQKKAFNEEIEGYIDGNGIGTKASDVKALLNNIISLNENYVDNAKNVVGVNMKTSDETFGKTVSESDKVDAAYVEELNGKLQEALDNINNDSTYTVKPIYKNNLILNVNITEE